jgi:hypothetical protein
VGRERVPGTGGNGELAGPCRRRGGARSVVSSTRTGSGSGSPMAGSYANKYTGVAGHGAPMTGADGRAMGAVDA